MPDLRSNLVAHTRFHLVVQKAVEAVTFATFHSNKTAVGVGTETQVRRAEESKNVKNAACAALQVHATNIPEGRCVGRLIIGQASEYVTVEISPGRAKSFSSYHV
jgi:hypothetical protein